MEGFENVAPAVLPIEPPQVAAVRIGDDRAIAASQCAMQDLLDSGAFSRAGGTDQFEMFGFILRGHFKARQGDSRAVGRPAGLRLPRRRLLFDQGPALLQSM